MKIDFSKVLLQGPSTLNGPDGWSKGWVASWCESSSRLRCHQGGGRIMFWAEIIDGTMIRRWRVSEGVNMTAETRITFLKECLELWFKRQRITLRRTMMFIQYNALSRSV